MDVDILRILDRSLRFASSQKRYKASVYDIELVFFYEGIKIGSLETEMKQRVGTNYDLKEGCMIIQFMLATKLLFRCICI